MKAIITVWAIVSVFNISCASTMSHDAVKRVGKNPNFIKIIAKVLTTPLAMLKFVLPVYHLIVAAGYIFYLVSKKDYEEYMGTVTTEIKKKI